MLGIDLFFVEAFIAAAVAGVVGFGTATLTIPFLVWIIGFKQAIILIAFFHGFSNLFRLVKLRRSVNIRLMLLYGIPSIITAIIGACLLDIVAPKGIGLAAGIFLIIFSIYSLINPRWILPQKNYILISGGLLSGFTSGLIGLGGAIRSAFLISTSIPKETYVATMAAISLVTDIARCSTYIIRGSLESQYYWYIPVLFVVGYLGTWAGVKLLKQFTDSIVRRAVLVVLSLVSVCFIFNYLGLVNIG